MRDGLKSSIQAQLNKSNQDITDWQEVIEQAINVKAKINYQIPFLVRESDACYAYGYRLTKRDSKEKKDSKVKKTPKTFTANQNCNSSDGQTNQSSETGKTSGKKSFHLRKSKKVQSSNIPAIRVNIIMVKKDKKQSDSNLSQVECFAYHKKGYYANRSLNKEPKTSVSLGNSYIFRILFSLEGK